MKNATVFIEGLRIGQNLAKKLMFLLILRDFYLCPLDLYPTSYATNFFQIKGLINIYIYRKFHQYSICGCEVENFQRFSYWFSIHEWPLLGFFGPYSSKYCFKLAEVSTRRSVLIRKTVFEKSFKILNFCSNGMHPKFTVLFQFGAQFAARKPKILLKTKISAKTAPLTLSWDLRYLILK